MSNYPELPHVGGRTTDNIIGFRHDSKVFEITDTPKQLDPGEKFTRLGIENPSENSLSVFIGGKNVVANDAALAEDQKRGRELAPGDVREENAVVAPYAVAPTGQTIYIVVEWAH